MHSLTYSHILMCPPHTGATQEQPTLDQKGKLSESERALTRNMSKKAWSGAPLLTSITGIPVSGVLF